MGVESQLGFGSTFWFTVGFGNVLTDAPLHAVPNQAEGRAQTTPGPRASLSVLLAEDNKINQKVAVALLKRAGHRVQVVANGRDAVLESGRGDFDVILMDVQMPEADGIQATEMIRARETESGEHVPIIALTAHAMQGDRERCIRAGMDDYLPKPLSADALDEKLSSEMILGRRTMRASRLPQQVSEPAL